MSKMVMSEQNQRKKDAIVQKIQSYILPSIWVHMVVKDIGTDVPEFFYIQYAIFEKTRLIFELNLDNDGGEYSFSIRLNPFRALKRGIRLDETLKINDFSIVSKKISFGVYSVNDLTFSDALYLLPKFYYFDKLHEHTHTEIDKIHSALNQLKEELSLKPSCDACQFAGGSQFIMARKDFAEKQNQNQNQNQKRAHKDDDNDNEKEKKKNCRKKSRRNSL